MTSHRAAWRTIHPSALGHAAALMRPAAAQPRAHGALRYQCPVTDSLVLVTDEASLEQLAGRRARMRCPACGEMHLLTRDETAAAPAIVATGGAA